MWTAENRPRYNRDKLRYPSDLTNQEWAYVEPLIPPAKRGGGKRRVDIREVVNGVMYILSTGCQWRYLPKDLPPKSTVHDYLSLWNWVTALRSRAFSLLSTLIVVFWRRDLSGPYAVGRPRRTAASTASPRPPGA